MVETIAEIRKSELASLIGVTKGRVSQLIAEGKLSGAALTSAGLINRDEALRQLGKTLDQVKRAEQGKAVLQPEPSATPDPAEPELALDNDQKRHLKARADVEESKAERLRRELREQDGRWVIAGDARAAFVKVIAEILTRINAETASMGTAIAAELKSDPKLATFAVRRAMRATLGKIAAELRRQGEALPAFVDAPEDEAA